MNKSEEPIDQKEHKRTSLPLWPIVVLIAVCTVVELALQASDIGLIEVTRLRPTVYEYGGFWPGLLRDWRANYPVQPYTMFISYAFLHGGLAHLVVNMITLASLGIAVIARVGVRGFFIVYLAAILGGGLGFGLLAETLRPMVGASGALFGLAGALSAWEFVDRLSLRDGLWPVFRTILFLVLLNVVLWWAMNGQLAWETHLGGFIAGWIAALLVDPRGHVSEDED